MAFESPDIQRKTPLGRNFNGYIRKKPPPLSPLCFGV